MSFVAHSHFLKLKQRSSRGELLPEKLYFHFFVEKFIFKDKTFCF